MRMTTGGALVSMFVMLVKAECERIVNGTQVSCQTDFSSGVAIAGYAAVGVILTGLFCCGMHKLQKKDSGNPAEEKFLTRA